MISSTLLWPPAGRPQRYGLAGAAIPPRPAGTRWPGTWRSPRSARYARCARWCGSHRPRQPGQQIPAQIPPLRPDRTQPAPHRAPSRPETRHHRVTCHARPCRTRSFNCFTVGHHLVGAAIRCSAHEQGAGPRHLGFLPATHPAYLAGAHHFGNTPHCAAAWRHTPPPDGMKENSQPCGTPSAEKLSVIVCFLQCGRGVIPEREARDLLTEPGNRPVPRARPSGGARTGLHPIGWMELAPP
jgi:hypothetical protein